MRSLESEKQWVKGWKKTGHVAWHTYCLLSHLSALALIFISPSLWRRRLRGTGQLSGVSAASQNNYVTVCGAHRTIWDTTRSSWAGKRLYNLAWQAPFSAAIVPSSLTPLCCYNYYTTFFIFWLNHMYCNNLTYMLFISTCILSRVLHYCACIVLCVVM